MRIWSTPLTALVLALTTVAPAALGLSIPSVKLVSDELVTNLRCSNLSSDSIYKAVSPDAFYHDRRITTANKDLISEVSSFGDCWSLSRWQRLNLLLGRQDNDTLHYSPMMISNLIRGKEPVQDGPALARFGMSRMNEVRLKSYEVFALPPSINYGSPMQRLDSDLQALTPARTYFRDLHEFQKSQFYRVSNLYYVVMPRSPSANMLQLVHAGVLANQHRLPMIILRERATYQHVVLMIGMKKTDPDNYEFEVIDPNVPWDQGKEITATRSGTSWLISYGGFDSPDAPVDVFLTGEDERPQIDAALLKYYTTRCQQHSG